MKYKEAWDIIKTDHPLTKLMGNPKFSWEKPIEEEILEFCRNMALQMERVANKPNNGLFGSSFIDTDKGIRKEASNYANAYRTVERHILRELKLRGNFDE